jgi:hypothetical protein
VYYGSGTTITNMTGTLPSSPSNYTILGTFNVTTGPSGANITISYPCSPSASGYALFIAKNGTWIPLTSFTVNTAACTITAHVPQDPVVGLFQQAPVPTTTATTTTPQSNNNNYYYVAGVIVVIIIVAAAVAVARSRRRPASQTS